MNQQEPWYSVSQSRVTEKGQRRKKSLTCIDLGIFFVLTKNSVKFPPNGNLLLLLLFSLSKNWMHNVVWGCAEILPKTLGVQIKETFNSQYR